MTAPRPLLAWIPLAVALAAACGGGSGPPPGADAGASPDAAALLDSAGSDAAPPDVPADAPGDAPAEGTADAPSDQIGSAPDAPLDGPGDVPVASAVCLTMPTPSCSNGMVDGDEVDIDCGGSCPRCSVGALCTDKRDCATARCVSGRCGTVPSACADGVKNGSETDIDCGGGTCAPCPDGRTCLQGADCGGLSCTGVAGCQTPTLLAIDVGGQGRVTSSQLELDCTSSCTVRIPSYVNKFTITATPAAGWRSSSFVVCRKYALSDTQCEPYWADSNALELTWPYYDQARIPGRIRVGFSDTTRAVEQWDRVWASDVSNLEGAPPRVALDAASNTLFATLILGNGTFGGVPSSGPSNVLHLLMGKVSTAGDVVWLHRYPAINALAAIALDGSGGPVVSGRANPDMTALGGPALTECAQKAATTTVSYVARYGPAGNHLWSRCVPGAVKGTVFDGQGNVVLAGTTPAGAWDFGGGISGTAGGAGFLVRLAAADGRAVAIRTFPGAEPQVLAATPDGRIVVLGEHRVDVDLGGGPLRTSATGGDFHLASFTGDFQHTWSRAFAGAVTMVDGWAPLAPLADGGILLGGTSVWPSGFGCPTSQPHGRFLARIDAAGRPLWFREVKSRSIRMSLAAGRDLFAVTGSCPHTGPCDFGAGPLALAGPGPTFSDDFLALYSLDGQPLWSSHLDLGLLQRGGRLGAAHATVAMDPDGNLSVLSHTLTRLRP